MRKGLFPSLAWQNLRKNGKFYLPYILTVICTVAGFYIINAIASDKGVSELRGASYVYTMMSWGNFIISIFAVIFLLYTNSFLMKRRNKELALYNILGMEKRHIARVLCYEAFYVAFMGISGGLVCGILLHKLVTLILFKLLHFDVPFGFKVSSVGIEASLILFSVIIGVTLFFNLIRIGKAKPIELLKSTDAGEREPKSKWLLTLVGVLALGAGYYIALTTKTALKALELYFLAVFLVIIGTYCLFTSVSIVILKLLRKNRKIYYKTKYFIGISGMMYRMKQNAVGLANICILSTMVLVMVSGTLSLYLGTEETLKEYYPGQINLNVTINAESDRKFNDEVLKEKVKEIISKNRGEITRYQDYSYLAFTVGIGEGYFHTNIERRLGAEIMQVCFITEEDFKKLTGKEVNLKDNEILLFDTTGEKRDKVILKTGDYTFDFTVAEQLESFPSIGNLALYMVDKGYMVVKDEKVLYKIYEGQKSAYKDIANNIEWVAVIDTDLMEDIQVKCAVEISNLSSEDSIGEYKSFDVGTRAQGSVEIYALNGGFLFLGIFLGLIFIMATVLIIYYKQISEGYEDKSRFEIMQQVGLPKKEIRSSIHAQILIVFFAPLLVAAIHVAFDFKLMIKLLSLFALTNVKLTMLCTIITLLGFAVMYGFVYGLTARTYYKIVSTQ